MNRYVLGLLWFTLLTTIVGGGIALFAEENPQHRRPGNEADLRSWLENMVWYHQFSPIEIEAATGMPPDEITRVVKRFDLRREGRPVRGEADPLVVLPYPGGRHPRIGFLEGAIRPQRETKVSVFTPWNPASYVVLDVPEAIWWNNGGRRELLYLAHTHVPTTWSRQGIELEPLEWERQDGDTLQVERTLPNGVIFGTRVTPSKDSVQMSMWLTNGTDKKLTGLRVQACAMFKGAPEFAALTNDNKVFTKPYAACRSNKANRWVITAWEPCERVWGNPPCPCLHSDPQFADCQPGETVRLRGILSFYEGERIEQEFQRIDDRWRQNGP